MLCNCASSSAFIKVAGSVKVVNLSCLDVLFNFVARCAGSTTAAELPLYDLTYVRSAVGRRVDLLMVVTDETS